MHELGIAQSIIEAATALLPEGTTNVATMCLTLGARAGLSEEELRFGFEIMSVNTPFEETKLEIEVIPAVAHCPICGKDFALAEEDALLCPVCGSLAVVLVQGKEVLIKSIVADTEANVEATYG